MQLNKKALKGSALLTALFIMTLVSIAATVMSMRLQLDIYRTHQTIIHDKLYLASQAVMFWSFNELQNPHNKYTVATAQGSVAHLPKNLSSLYKGVTLSGRLYDAQSKINLNNLLEKKNTPFFIHFLQQIDSKHTNEEHIKLALALQNWLSTYDLSHGKDEYISYYIGQKPPYYPSHQPIQSRSEFRLLKEVSSSLDTMLQPYLIALPESTPININTASKAVLMALGDGLNATQADELIEQRGTEGFQNTQELNPVLQKLNIANEQITLESQYFVSKAQVQSETMSLTVYVLLKREKTKRGRFRVSVIKQSFNIF